MVIAFISIRMKVTSRLIFMLIPAMVNANFGLSPFGLQKIKAFPRMNYRLLSE
jgi:hypothetical protein